MANTLNIHSFDLKNALVHALADSMQEDIGRAVEKHGDARILLSGGSTPGPVYRELDARLTKKQHILLGLVDERYVPFESEYSNERLIRECFPQVTGVSGKVSGMVYDLNDEEANIQQVILAYQPFFERTDLCLLGMGEDGHFASIFPNDPASGLALQTTSQAIRSTRAPNFPNQRITWDLECLRKAESTYLLITGEKKINLLLDSALNLPIHTLLSVNPELKIFYSK